MIQTAVKVLTLGFFISMISGFVLYRSGYFEAEHAHYALQKSPNGGELNNVIIEQDSTKTETIRQMNNMPIMPSSKSMSPMLNIEDLVPSSKSMLHPIDIDWDSVFLVDNPYASSSKSTILNHDWIKLLDIKALSKSIVQPKTLKVDISSVEKDTEMNTAVKATTIEKKEKPRIQKEKPDGISWGMIGLGVLGILFVGIGSILYFKRRSK